jgi:hypothetical protein
LSVEPYEREVADLGVAHDGMVCHARLVSNAA